MAATAVDDNHCVAKPGGRGLAQRGNDDIIVVAHVEERANAELRGRGRVDAPQKARVSGRQEAAEDDGEAERVGGRVREVQYGHRAALRVAHQPIKRALSGDEIVKIVERVVGPIRGCRQSSAGRESSALATRWIADPHTARVRCRRPDISDLSTTEPRRDGLHA